MSGIYGIVTSSDQRIEESELRRMAEAAPHRGIDGSTFWQNHEAGLGFLSLAITLEALLESQPLDVGHSVLVADARVDNRTELVRTLDLPIDNPTDADLIIAAYHRWGVDCPRHIIGDFAFALWDKLEKRLLLARDPMGMRALYYRLERNRLLFATEVKQIIAVPGVPVEIFEPALAAYFAGPNMPPEWTFYSGVDQMAAGTALLFEHGKCRLWRFWDIDPDYRITYKGEDNYAAHFRELFKEAVACRLRSIKPVGLSLSGGMDSSSIASMAGWLMLHDGTRSYPPFLAFCHAFNEFPECDERHISSLVTDHFDFPSIDVPTEQAWPLIDYPAHGPDRDEPYIGVYQALIELDLAMARERNVGLLMSGDRGDLLTAGWSFDYWGMLLKGHWRVLWNELRADSQFRQRSIVRIMRRHLFLPMLVKMWPQHRASWLREKIRRSLGRPQPQKGYPPWVCDDFARRSCLEQTVRQYHAPVSPIREFGRKWRYEMIFTHMHMRGVVWSERNQARFGIGFADPWSDRRLAEFVLAIPHEIVNRPREYKRLTQKAMQGVMPEEVRNSVSKILPTPYYFHAFRENARSTISDLIENSTAHDRGYIDKAALRTEYRSILRGNLDHPNFWWALTVEMWLRQFWS
jgi:asparagine synthase (glutamine-hydrolysing)